MRLYVPVTLAEIDALTGPSITLAPRRAHAATPALVAELTEEGIDDLEEIEYIAQLSAADDSLVLIAANPAVPWLRAVLSVDVPEAIVRPAEPRDEDGALSSAVDLVERVTVPVVCAHVDEPEAAADIQDVMSGDDDAIDRLADRDLLWYDVTEFGAIPR